MKIKIVIYSQLMAHGGGRETWIEYFLEMLLKNNYEVEVYCLEEMLEGSLITKSKFTNIVFYTVKFNRASKLNFKNFLKKTGENLIANHNGNDCYLFVGSIVEGCLLLKLKKMKPNAVCYTWVRSITANEISNRHFKMLSFVPSIIERKVMRESDYVITNGYDTFAYYVDKYGVQDKCTVLPNAVNLEMFKFTTKPIGEHGVSFLYFGRLTSIKGVYDILDLFNRLVVDGIFMCHFYGEGDDITEFKKNSHCQIHGPLDHEFAPEVYSKTNVSFFLGKGAEKGGGGISHSLLEALASGHICICYDIPAYNQIINNGINGILVKYQDNEDLQKKVISLIEDCNLELYYNMQINARKTAEQYSIEKHFLKFENLFLDKDKIC